MEKTFQMTLAGRPLVIETGQLAQFCQRLLPGPLRRHGHPVDGHRLDDTAGRHRLFPAQRRL